MSYEFTRQKIEVERRALVRKRQRMGLAVIAGIAVLALIYGAFGLYTLFGVMFLGGLIGAALHIISN